MVTSCAASTRRSSVGLSVRSLVNQALRGLQSPLLAEPGALAPGSECANVVWFDLDRRHVPRAVLEFLNFSNSSSYKTERPGGHCVPLAQPEAKRVKRQHTLCESWL